MRSANDNPDLARATGPHGDLPDDPHEEQAIDAFAVSKLSLFLPAFMVIVLYGALFGWFVATGRADTSLGRLSGLVLALGGPVLMAHAVLRALTVRVRPMGHTLYIHPGFPRFDAVEIPYGEIIDIDVLRGVGGHVARSGTLVFHLRTGRQIAACDLHYPEAARHTALLLQARHAINEVSAALPAEDEATPARRLPGR